MTGPFGDAPVRLVHGSGTTPQQDMDLSTRVLVMSARPGQIVAEFAVPFAYPRMPDLRFEPAFAELCGQISHELRGAHT